MPAAFKTAWEVTLWRSFVGFCFCFSFSFPYIIQDIIMHWKIPWWGPQSLVLVDVQEVTSTCCPWGRSSDREGRPLQTQTLKDIGVAFTQQGFPPLCLSHSGMNIPFLQLSPVLSQECLPGQSRVYNNTEMLFITFYVFIILIFRWITISELCFLALFDRPKAFAVCCWGFPHRYKEKVSFNSLTCGGRAWTEGTGGGGESSLDYLQYWTQ